MKKDSRILVAGCNGLVGSSITRALQKQGYRNLILIDRKEVDLLDQKAVEKYFAKVKPEYVFLAAAKVGGILANERYKAEFIYQNLQIQTNVIYNAWKCKVKKLLFLGSSCIYPKKCPQPIKEKYFLTGPLEETNDAYAVAKIAGIKMCQSFNEEYGSNFISVMPTNLYGPNDNFKLEDSHVLPALIRKFHEGKINNKKEVVLWGTGSPKREFLFVEDLADALIFLMNHYDHSEIINIGVGKDLNIKELSEIIKKIVGFKGKVVWDSKKPNGTPRKLLDITKLNKLGWKAKTPFEEGVKKTYMWFKENYEEILKKEKSKTSK